MIFLREYTYQKISFGLDPQIDYIIKDAQLISDTQYIEPYVNDKNSLIIELKQCIS